MKEVELFADGACSGNPGIGGWGAILRCEGREKELSGGEPLTTNNRMELGAVIAGLTALKEPCRVRVCTDSRYVKDGITSWIGRWLENGWKTRSGDPVKNRDLWTELHKLAERHELSWLWVAGHAGHPENERCDLLARGWVEAHRGGAGL